MRLSPDMDGIPQKSLSLLSFSLMKKTNKRDVRVVPVSCCLGEQGRSPKLDSMCKSLSKHKVSEEVNCQFARRISHVATTGMAPASGKRSSRKATQDHSAWSIVS